MRDPRFESAQVRLRAPCVVGYPRPCWSAVCPAWMTRFEIEIASLGLGGGPQSVKAAATAEGGYAGI